MPEDTMGEPANDRGQAVTDDVLVRIAQKAKLEGGRDVRYELGFADGAEWAWAEAQRELAARVLEVLKDTECLQCRAGGHRVYCDREVLISELRALTEGVDND